MVNKIIKVAGIDPGLTYMGVTYADLDLSDYTFKPTELKLFKTEKSKLKLQRAASEDFRRCRALHDKLILATKNVELAFIEIPSSGAKSADAMKALVMTTAIMSTCPKMVIQLEPGEVKLAALQKRSGTKPEMIKWAMTLHPELDWMMRKLHGEMVPLNANEHLADSLACLYAGMVNDQFHDYVKILESFYEAKSPEKIAI